MSISTQTVSVKKSFAMGALLAFAVGCGSGGSDKSVDAGQSDGAVDGAVADAANPLLESRPYRIYLPDGYTGATPKPFVLLLHGYGASGPAQDLYLGMSAVADSNDFIYAYSNGTEDQSGKLFWNATDSCCNFDGRTVDDVAYLTAIIDDVEAKYNVDKKRIYIVGHSNGGFMAHRLACELSPRIAGIVSIAGAQWKDPSRCTPTEPVTVLQIHGTADQTIRYQGGTIPGTAPIMYPSAHDTVAMWANKNHCGTLQTGATIDLDDGVGAETAIERYSACFNSAVELWTINNGPHIPVFKANWGDTVFEFLYAHPKP